MATGSLDKAWGLAREVEKRGSTWSYTHRNDRYFVNQSFIENFPDCKSALEAIKKRRSGSSAICMFVTFGSNQSSFTDDDDISLLWFSPVTKETPNPELHHQLVGILVDDINPEAVPNGKYIWADVQATGHADVWSPGSDAAIRMNEATRKHMHDVYGRPPRKTLHELYGTNKEDLHNYRFNQNGDTWALNVFQLNEFFIVHNLLDKENELWKYLGLYDLSRLSREMGMKSFINVPFNDLQETVYDMIITAMRGKSPPPVAEDTFGRISSEQVRVMLQDFDLHGDVGSFKAKADQIDTFMTRRGFWRRAPRDSYVREDVMKMSYIKRIIYRLAGSNTAILSRLEEKD